MQKIISSNFFIFSALFLLVLSFGIFTQKTNLFTTEVANAGVLDNVSGWAWANTPQSSGAPTTGTNQGVGWISFNCIDREASEGKICLDRNDATFNSAVNIIDYGVTIDLNTGDFSGEAWSENIGWISFDRVETGDPDSDDIGSGSGAIASVDASTGVVTGWARAVSGISGSGGFDGWVKLSGTATNGSPYGVTVNTSTSEFSGYAWGDSVIGWVDFDPSNSNTGDIGVKITGTLNQAPGPMNITAPLTGLTGEAISYTFQAPDGDTPPDDVRYYIDWENDGTVDAWYPSSSTYTPSNTSYATTHTWSTATTYTVAAWAVDTKGAISPIATKPITISVPDCSNNNDDDGDLLIDEADPGCWIDPTLGNTPANYDPRDNNEADPECYNSNFDDDLDGVADANDPGCWIDPALGNTPANYDAADDDENNCGNGLCEPNTKENFISCSVDCTAGLEEF